MQEFGTALFNSGIADGLKGLMDIFGDLLEMFTNAPAPIKETVVALLEMVTVFQTVKQLSKITGIGESFMATAKYGTQEQRQLAEDTFRATSMMLEQELQARRTTAAFYDYNGATDEQRAKIEKQISTLESLNKKLLDLNQQYIKGKMRADEYTEAQKKLGSEIQKARLNLNKDTEATTKNTDANIKNAEAQKAETAATEKSATAVQKSISANKKNTDSENLETQAVNQNTKAKIENANADEVKTKAKLKDIVAQKAQTVATKAQTVAEKALNGVRAIGQSLLATLKNPLTWVPAAIGAVKLLTSAFKSQNERIQEAKEHYEETSQELESVSSELETAKQKVEELEGLENPTFTDEQDLARLREQVSLLEQRNKELKEESEQAKVDYNDEIIKGLNSAGYDYSDRYTDLYDGTTELMSYTKAAFDPKTFSDFIIEVEGARSELEKLDEGTAEYAIKSTEYSNKIGMIGDVISGLDDIFANVDVTQLTDENLKAYQSYMLLKSGVEAFNEGGSFESGMVEYALTTDEIQKQALSLIELGKAGELTEEKLRDFGVFNSLLDTGIITVDELTNEIINMGSSIENVQFESFDISGLQESAEKISNISDSINDDIMNLFEGNYDSSDILRMTEDYEGFRDVANATVAEQIAWLQEYKATASDAFGADVQAAMSALNEQYSTLITRLQEIGYYSESAGSWVPYDQDDSETIMQLEDDLVEVENKLKDVQNYAYIDVDFNMGDAVSQINSMISAVDGLVEAQNKLASGTALSQQELWKLAQTYPELLSQINLFSASSVSEQEAAISAVLDMKNQEKNAWIDAEIIKLQAKADALTQQIALEDQKAAVLDEIHAMELQGKTTQDADYQDKLAEYNELEKQNYYNLEEDKVVTNNNANATIGQNEASASQNTAQIYQANADALAAATAAGAQAAGNNIWAVVESTGRKIAKLEPTLSSLSKSINAAFAGAAVGISVAKGNGSVSGLT